MSNETANSDAMQSAVAEVEQEIDQAVEKLRLKLDLGISDVGPCKKHIKINVAKDSIDEVRDKVVTDMSGKAAVPGFRVGHVPTKLLEKRFKKEIYEEVRQKVLMHSLEQLSENKDLDPINEPNIDLDSLEIPDDADFQFEFDIEVRPKFDLPSYKGLQLKRSVRTITDSDASEHLSRWLEQFVVLTPVDRAVAPGDAVTVNVSLAHGGNELRTWNDVEFRVRPILRFRDAELKDIDKLFKGAAVGDTREAEATVSAEAPNIEMRNEKVKVTFTILGVKEAKAPDLTPEFLKQYGYETAEEVNAAVRSMLERQETYEQRQSTRRQVLDKITESANWDLPEDLLRKQVENALYRELLEMQQAGFTEEQIRAREAHLRQNSLTTTRRNLKEHFVLDRIAEAEGITVSQSDVDVEITNMALQRGENPRRLRARMVKSNVIENLEAQIRERKAVDVILDHAKFTDVAAPARENLSRIEVVNRSICADSSAVDVEHEDEEADDEE